jgi:lipoprotein NlpD
MYDIDLDEIVRVNRISDAANIEAGQLILIPRRQKQAAAYGSFNDFAWPLKGRVIAGFGATKGLNIQTTINDDISAARAGKVVFYAEEFQGYGKTVIIDHGDGFMTVYAGLGRVQVNPGQSVEKGAVIATGQREGLLHFEIRKGPLAQNPYFYLTR